MNKQTEKELKNALEMLEKLAYCVQKTCQEALEQPAQDDDLMTGTWIRYNDGDDNKRLALELDIAMNGVDGAAKSPALIDVLAQAVDYFKNAKTYHILPIDDIKEHEESAYCDCYPRIEPHGLNNVVIHNSFDGREALEQPIAHINVGDKGKVTFEEQPARLVSYAPDKSTCTLNIDGEEVYFNREQPASKNIRESFNEMLDDKVAYYKGKQPAQNYRTVTDDNKLTENQGKVTERETQEVKCNPHPDAPSWVST